MTAKMFQMDLLDKIYVEKFQDQELEFLIKDLRSRVLETEFAGSIVPRTDPEFLARFLRVKDRNVEKALKGVQRYYICIDKHMDEHKGLKPSQVASIFYSETCLPLKHRFDGVAVGVGRIKYWDPKKEKLKDFQRAAIFGAEHYLYDVAIQENGVSGIVDFEGLGLRHIWHATIKEIKQCLQVGLKGLPARLGQGHVLNAPRIFWPIYHIGKRFVKQKYVDKVHFHDNLESLHKFFDKRFLPESLGGELSDFDACEWHVRDELLDNDIPYEKYWNGAIWKPELEDLHRIRSMSAELKQG